MYLTNWWIYYPNCKIYLTKLQNGFVQIAKCSCPNCKMYLSKLQNVFVQIAKCICPNWKMYLSILANVFVQIANCICPNCKMHLSKLQNVFVQIVKSIYPNCKMYLSKLTNKLDCGVERVFTGCCENSHVLVQSSCQLAHHGACELVFYWGKICYEARFLLNGLLVQLNFYICNSISGLSTSIWLQNMSFNICEHEQGGHLHTDPPKLGGWYFDVKQVWLLICIYPSRIATTFRPPLHHMIISLFWTTHPDQISDWQISVICYWPININLGKVNLCWRRSA